MLQTFGSILVILGYIMLALATISGVGYFLWLFGPAGLTLAMAAWEGFVLFLKMTIAGVVSMGLGAIGMYSGK